MALNWSFLRNITDALNIKKLNDFLMSVGKKVSQAETDIVTLQANIGGVAGNPARCVLYQNTAQTLSTGVLTPVNFDTEISDTEGGWSSSDPSKVYCKKAGTYNITASVYFDINATGVRIVQIFKNGSYFAEARAAAAAGLQTTPCAAVNGVELAVDDYIQVKAYQSSGGNLQISTDANYTRLGIVASIGEKGDPGAKGDPGDKGDPGTPGADAPTVGIQFSVDAVNFHYGYVSGDQYFRMTADGEATWTDPALFVGPEGDPGSPGVKGDTGEGVPTGGTTGQALKKKSNTDYDTEWGDVAGGTGGTADAVANQNDSSANDPLKVWEGTKAEYEALTPAADTVYIINDETPSYAMAPDTNTDGYIPQWDGADSKTLKGGIPYATGTFTPTIGGSTTDGTISYSGQGGFYTKIGNIVTVFIRLVVNTVTSAPTGNLQIKGLPYAAVNNAGFRAQGAVWAHGVDWGTSKTQLVTTINGGQQVLNLYGLQNNAVYAQLSGSGLASGDNIYTTITYMTD